MKLWDSELHQEVWYTIRSNKKRSIITTLGIFFGMLFLTVMVSIAMGLQNGIRGSISDLGSNFYMFYNQETTLPYKGYKANRDVPFTYGDFNILQQRDLNGTILTCYKYLMDGSSFRVPVILDNKKKDLTVSGVSEHYLEINNHRVLYGRNIRAHEITEKRPICLIGIKSVEKMGLKGDEVIGHILQVNNITFNVVGVVADISSNVSINMGFSEGVIVPINFATNNDNQSPVFITALPGKGVTGDDIKEMLFTYMSKKYSIHPDDKDVYGYMSMQDLMNFFGIITQWVNVLVWLIALGTLITGVISVSNILLVTIRERNREIGIRRALGAKPKDIIQQFMNESVVLISVAGFSGMFIGLIFTLLIGNIIENTPKLSSVITNPYPSPFILLLSIVIVIICGVGAGLLPVSQAIKIKAIDAIRDE